MNTHTILSGALAVQVGLAAITWWPSGDAIIEATPLVDGGGNSITHIEVLAGRDDAEPVVLDAAGGSWVITSEEGYPADAEKIAEVVDALGEITLRAPVAYNASNHEQFKVDPDAFGRRVTFTANGSEQTIWVGSAASKAVYLRKDGEDEVYKVKGLAEFTLKDTARSYWATNYVEYDKDAITAFSLTNEHGAVAFEKQDGAWALIGGPEGMQANSSEVDELVDKASRVRLSEPVGKTVEPSFALGAAEISWTETQEDQPLSLSLSIGAEKDSKLYVKADGNDFVVLAPKYRLEDLLKAMPADLMEPAPEAAPAEGAEE